VLGAKESRHLQPKTMDVLVCLAESSGQVLTRDELIERVWGANAVSDEPLTRCIHELRRALDDDRGEPTFIQTIPKRGYRLLKEVRELGEAEELVLQHTEPGENPLRQVSRQRVLWVGLAYAVLAWLFVTLGRWAEQQAGAEIAPPDWLMPSLIIILLLGFPVAVFFAWVQQLKFDGLGFAFADKGTFAGMRSLLWSRRGIDMVLVTLVMSLLAGLAFDMVPLSRAEPILDKRPELAIMPFASVGEDMDENWLGKGLAEDLHARLTGHPGLALSSISVSFRPSLEGLRPQQIGHELDAQYILRGRVLRGREDLRIKAWVIDTVTGLEIWSAAYTGDPENLFVMQREISASVLGALDLSPLAESADMEAPLSIAAYQNYLRGRSILRDAGSIETAAEAARWFELALMADEQLPMARNGLCQAYTLLLELDGGDGIYGRANTACAEAILHDPDSSAAHLVLADFYRVSGHGDEAINEYRRVIDQRPHDSSAWFGLARVHAADGSAADAEDAFRRVLSIKPDCADAHEVFVSFLIDEGRYEEALEVARYLVRLDSDRVSSYEYLAQALFMNGYFHASIRASRQVLSRDIRRRGAVLQIARSYYFMGRFDEAAKIYTQAAKLMAGDHKAHGGLGSAYTQMADAESQRIALQAFARARYLSERDLLENPEDVDTVIDLAYYCSALGDRQCAQQRLNQALDMAPQNVRTHYMAALVHASFGDLRAASIATQRALALGYPEALISTDPLLASAWSERRLAYRRFSAMF
jgi:DNA-binding winged helix-turn-helix (wHTH) protein/tetratricopeptide (TPR) repeat protein